MTLTLDLGLADKPRRVLTSPAPLAVVVCDCAVRTRVRMGGAARTAAGRGQALESVPAECTPSAAARRQSAVEYTELAA